MTGVNRLAKPVLKVLRLPSNEKSIPRPPEVLPPYIIVARKAALGLLGHSK